MHQPHRTPKKLLDRVRDVIRLKNYSIRTERAYVEWIKRYILFHKTKQGFVLHPREMAEPEIEAFLTHLAVEQNVAPSTQNQALSALLFLYREIIKIEPEGINAVRARKPKRLPTVMTREEVQKVIGLMTGIYQLMAKLLYGSGLRLMECVRLRAEGLMVHPLVRPLRAKRGFPLH